MPDFEVLFRPGADLKIRVRVEPDEDEDQQELVERAIELACDRIPESLICPQDQGWGDKDYSLDVSGTDIEPYAVYDGSGTPLFEEKTQVELLYSENVLLERRLQDALAELTRLRDDAGIGLHKALDPIEKVLRGAR